MSPGKDKAKTTKEEGITIVSSFGTSFTPTEIVDAEVLKDYQDHNFWSIGLTEKQKNLVFTDKPIYEVLDSKGEVDKELGQRITNMCEKIRLGAKMQLGYTDGIFWYGIGIFNPIWSYEGAEYVLTDLRYLPAYTFRNIGSSQLLTYSELLPGITLDDKKEFEFWQTDDIGQINQLKNKNLFWIKDPSVAALTGKSVMRPIIPIFEMLKFSWTTVMQYMNRVGAPIIFIKITDPQPASARLDGVSDVDYATKLLEKWGKDTGFILRENMEKFELNITKDSSNLETIDALYIMIIDYMTPSAFISRTSGQSLGESDKSRENFFYKYIKGIHIWLEDQFEGLLQQYLDKNGYKGYILNIHIPSPTIDRSEIELQQAKVGKETHSLFVNERRKRLGAESLDENELKKLEDEFARAPASISSGFETNIATHERALQKELDKAAAEFSKDVLKVLRYEEK